MGLHHAPPSPSWWFQASGSRPPPTSGTPGSYAQNTSQYKLEFSNEFNGSTLDTSKWIDHLWYPGADPTPNCDLGNGSLRMWPLAGPQ